MNRMSTLVAAVASLGLMASTQAAVISYDFGSEFSGGTAPAGAPPWIRVTITDVAADTVTVAFNNINLVGTEFVSKMYVNLNPALNATGLSFGSPVQVGTLRGQDIGKALILGVLGVGTILATLGVMLDAQWPKLFLDCFRDVK